MLIITFVVGILQDQALVWLASVRQLCSVSSGDPIGSRNCPTGNAGTLVGTGIVDASSVDCVIAPEEALFRMLVRVKIGIATEVVPVLPLLCKENANGSANNNADKQ